MLWREGGDTVALLVGTLRARTPPPYCDDAGASSLPYVRPPSTCPPPLDALLAGVDGALLARAFVATPPPPLGIAASLNLHDPRVVARLEQLSASGLSPVAADATCVLAALRAASGSRICVICATAAAGTALAAPAGSCAACGAVVCGRCLVASRAAGATMSGQELLVASHGAAQCTGGGGERRRPRRRRRATALAAALAVAGAAHGDDAPPPLPAPAVGAVAVAEERVAGAVAVEDHAREAQRLITAACVAVDAVGHADTTHLAAAATGALTAIDELSAVARRVPPGAGYAELCEDAIANLSTALSYNVAAVAATTRERVRSAVGDVSTKEGAARSDAYEKLHRVYEDVEEATAIIGSNSGDWRAVAQYAHIEFETCTWKMGLTAATVAVDECDWVLQRTRKEFEGTRRKTLLTYVINAVGGKHGKQTLDHARALLDALPDSYRDRDAIWRASALAALALITRTSAAYLAVANRVEAARMCAILTAVDCKDTEASPALAQARLPHARAVFAYVTELKGQTAACGDANDTHTVNMYLLVVSTRTLHCERGVHVAKRDLAVAVALDETLEAGAATRRRLLMTAAAAANDVDAVLRSCNLVAHEFIAADHPSSAVHNTYRTVVQGVLNANQTAMTTNQRITARLRVALNTSGGGGRQRRHRRRHAGAAASAVEPRADGEPEAPVARRDDVFVLRASGAADAVDAVARTDATHVAASASGPLIADPEMRAAATEAIALNNKAAALMEPGVEPDLASATRIAQEAGAVSRRCVAINARARGGGGDDGGAADATVFYAQFASATAACADVVLAITRMRLAGSAAVEAMRDEAVGAARRASSARAERSLDTLAGVLDDLRTALRSALEAQVTLDTAMLADTRWLTGPVGHWGAVFVRMRVASSTMEAVAARWWEALLARKDGGVG